MVQGDGITLSGDSKTTHKNARFCRRYRNRVVIPPAAVKAIVAQRGTSVANKTVTNRYGIIRRGQKQWLGGEKSTLLGWQA